MNDFPQANFRFHTTTFTHISRLNLPEPAPVTPLQIVTWFTLLSVSLINDAEWVSEGLRNGSAKHNCRSAYKHPFVINNYLQAELSAGTIAGPFSTLPLQDLHINRFGVIPNSTPGKFGLIKDLSLPVKATLMTKFQPAKQLSLILAFQRH